MAESSTPDRWRTALTDIGPGKIRIRGLDIAEVIRNMSFADAIYLMLRGTPPTPTHSRVMNAILASSIDHGLTPPSSLATRIVVSGGNPLNAAVAAGVLTIGDSHGGAIEECARMLQEGVIAGKKETAIAAKEIVADAQQTQRRLAGFGHRLHNPDPRTVALFEIAEEAGVTGAHVALAQAIEKVLGAKASKALPINVDGAIAALISDMGFDWRLGKGFFIISRVPGLVAHAVEEKTREKPMRKMVDFDVEWEG